LKILGFKIPNLKSIHRIYLYVLEGVRKYSCRYEGTLVVNIIPKMQNWNIKYKNYAFTCNSLSGTFPGFKFQQGQEIFLFSENPHISSAPSPSPSSLLPGYFLGDKAAGA
jgi:hypothetical protein